MNAVAASAQIGQAPLVNTVTYAITGDTETDLIAGLIAVTENRNADAHPAKMLARIHKYLHDRFTEQSIQEERAEAEMKRRQMVQGQVGSIVPDAVSITPGYEDVNKWKTASGTIGGKDLGSGASPSDLIARAKLIAAMREEREASNESKLKTFGDVLKSLPDIEPQPMKPGPMGWPVDDHH